MNILEQIFSIKNENFHKTINILGLKIKIKSYKQKTKKLEHKIEVLENFINVRYNYFEVLNTLRKKYYKQPINVIFIVAENSKWGYQSLYELFEKDEHFKPLVLITLLTSVHNGKDPTRRNLSENYNFFKTRGMNVEYLYQNNNYLDLECFNPDLIFYEQPWDLPQKYSPSVVSKYALTFFCPYSYSILNQKRVYYSEKFHCYLFTYFIEHELNLNYFKQFDKNLDKICHVVGFPKLDYFQSTTSKTSPIWKDPNKIKIIYAPHHSFDNSLKLATFHKNGQFILDLAKKHPETTWIFKPHPRFNYALMKVGIMTEKEIEEYYNEWTKVGTVYTQGDYLDIFNSSDAMITDCVSFTAEYLVTQKPLIRLISDIGVDLNKLGKELLSEYYEVDNNSDLENVFNDVIINKNDYKKEQRVKLIDKIIDKNKPASEKIFDYINNLLTT